MKPDLEASYVDFVTSRRTWLRRIAYALCGDWNRAEDLTQIACEKLYVAWPGVRRRGAEEAFARRVITRVSIDESRRPWRRERGGHDLVTADGGADAAREDQDVAVDVTERASLIEALQALPEMQRKVVVLRHLYDLSVRETAEELRISEGTVKSHSSRGMAAMARALDSVDLLLPVE